MMRKSMMLLPVATVVAQQAGGLTAEKQPSLTTKTCTTSGGCTQQSQSVTIDANWRWTHSVGGSTNCYNGNKWDASLCPDGKTCAANCALEGAGAEYTSTYGVNANGDTLQLDFVTQGPYSKNVGSRTYLMASETKYQMFHLKNKEFTFTVDDSALPCGLNGALYFVEMEEDGGMGQWAGNTAGAKFGTGYCDAQCPQDVKFINGEANSEGWVPSSTDPNSGTGKYGTCCTEMDIWEANSISTAYTPHACDTTGPYRCEGESDCGTGEHRFDGVCDANGCDMQTYRLGNTSFWGPGPSFAVDSNKPVQVVTQFITDDGTDDGELVEIRRLYVQNGVVIPTPSVKVGDSGSFDSVTSDYCKATAAFYDDKTNFLAKGGLGAMGKAFEHGMVLVMSLWDDHDVNMLWLDSTFPSDAAAGTPGAFRGTCPTTSGVPSDVESQHPDAHVKFSDIRWGDIGSTYTPSGPTPAPPAPTPSAPTPGGSCPGGSLKACIALCPTDPPAVFQACVQVCADECPNF